MITNIKNLYLTRDLILSWTGRIIRIRYQQSILGWLWAIIQPVASVLIFSIIFTRFVPVNTGGTPYVIFSYVTMVPWTFFSSALSDMTDSLVINMSLVTKIYFPRETLPISAMLARLFDFGIAAVIQVFLMIYFRVQIYPLGLLYLPFILMIQIALALGLGLATAALNIFIRDIQPLVRLGIQLWFYACPIIYPISLVPQNLRPYYFLNPMAGLLQAYRDILIDGKLPGDYLLLSAWITVVIFLLGYWFFKKVEFQFADIV
jgi:lipopolysaccharide transport system permease protein